MLLENIDQAIEFDNNFKIINYYYILLIFLILGIFFLLFPITKYKDYTLYVSSSNYNLIVDEDFFPIKNNNMYIDGKRYDYEVLNIDDNYLVDNKKYYDIVIDVDLDKSINKSKNIIHVKIKKGKTNLLKIIIEEMKGWSNAKTKW